MSILKTRKKLDKVVSNGLLYYMKDQHTQGIPAKTEEVRALLIRRNELAYYFNSNSFTFNSSLYTLHKV